MTMSKIFLKIILFIDVHSCNCIPEGLKVFHIVLSLKYSIQNKFSKFKISRKKEKTDLWTITINNNVIYCVIYFIYCISMCMYSVNG